MIASLRGLLIERNPPRLVVEVGGVGYELLAPLSTFSRLPEVGEEVRLFTLLRFQAEGAQLFGFATREERALFQELLRVSGIGPRTALAILSGTTVSELKEALATGDEARLKRLPGVGRKTAARLLLELRDRLAPLSDQRSEAIGQVEEALLALGFQPKEARRLLEGLQGASPEELLQKALRRASLKR